MRLGIGCGLGTPRNTGGAWAGVANPAARWSGTDSVKTNALDGTGAAPTDAALDGTSASRVGRALDLANGYYLTSSADAARHLWYADALGLGRGSFYSDLGGSRDLFNNTTLAQDVFDGADKPWTMCMLYARLSEDSGSNSYIWSVLGSGDSINGGAGNPTFTLRNDSGLHTAARPLFAQGFSRDNDASLLGTSTFDDGVFGLGAGSAVIVCVMVVKNPDRTVQVYQNGYKMADLTHTAGTWTFASGSFVNWGHSWNGSARVGSFLGHIYEMCIFGRALTADDRHATFGGYLGSLGVQYSPQTPVSRKTTWVFGNSIMLGNQPTVASPIQRLQRGGRLPWDETVVISNQSRGGLRFDLAGANNDLLECWALKHGTATTIKAGDPLIIGEITNYIASSDDTNNGTMQAALDAAMVKMKTCIDEALTESDRVVVMIDPPLGTSNAVRKAGLAYWKDQCLLVFGRKDRATVCNHYPYFDDGTGTLKAQYNSGDDVHLTGPAYELIADLLAAIYSHQRSVNPAVHANMLFWPSARNQDMTRTNGQAVDALVDLSATANNLSQATAGFRPTFRVGTLGTNWMPMVRFDGSDDCLEMSTVTVAANWTVLLVVDANGNGPLLASTTGSASILSVDAAAGLLTVQCTGGPMSFVSAPWGANAIVAVRSDGRAWVNGVEMFRTAMPGNVGWNANRLGGVSGGSFFTGDVGDLQVLNAQLSATGLNTLGLYLASPFKFNKTWTSLV